jgi:hypothetical protein
LFRIFMMENQKVRRPANGQFWRKEFLELKGGEVGNLLLLLCVSIC